ncbi:hypothetical protein LCGC14_1852230, partial [marine sediment metagenome]
PATTPGCSPSLAKDSHSATDIRSARLPASDAPMANSAPGVAVAVLLVFSVDRYAAGVVISAASLPVAGNVYMLAQHYGIAPQRVSASILISTALSIVTVTLVIAWVAGG